MRKSEISRTKLHHALRFVLGDWQVAAALALCAAAACSLDHDVDVTIGLDDSCIACLPICSPDPIDPVGETRVYHCVTDRGAPCIGCRVGCLAGRTLMCEMDGPHCEQELGDGIEFVPTICVLDEGARRR